MIMFLAADAGPNAADWLTGVGTVATAVLALAGVGVTIWLAERDRRQAQADRTQARADLEAERSAAAGRLQDERYQHQADIARTEAQLADDRRRADEQRATELTLRTLESVAEQYARFRGDRNHVEADEAIGRLNVLLRLLPDGMAAFLKYDLQVPAGPADQVKIKSLQEEKQTFNLPRPMPTNWIYQELGVNARQAAGFPPD